MQFDQTPMQLSTFRQADFSAAIAQWLVVLFLFQAALPVHAHSRMQTNDQGITIVVCTLQGEKPVELSLDSQHHDSRLSAAMQFSDLLAEFSPYSANAPLISAEFGLLPKQQHPQPQHRPATPLAPSSRAPPHA